MPPACVRACNPLGCSESGMVSGKATDLPATETVANTSQPGGLRHYRAASASALFSSAAFLTVRALMWRLLKEFLLFARQEKKWWLIPLIVLLVVLGAILIFASSSGIAWALYPFF